MFLPRYELVAVPGIALSWALVAGLIDSRTLRLLCALAMVAVMASISFTSKAARSHETSWKAALEFVEANASVDHAPVLICSGISESDRMVMPSGAAIEDSIVLTPLMYYKLTVPVVALPRSLNDEAVRVGSRFLEQATQQHERFLAMASGYSYGTLKWLSDHAMATDDVHELGVVDGFKILELSRASRMARVDPPEDPRCGPGSWTGLLTRGTRSSAHANCFLELEVWKRYQGVLSPQD